MNLKESLQKHGKVYISCVSHFKMTLFEKSLSTSGRTGEMLVEWK